MERPLTPDAPDARGPSDARDASGLAAVTIREATPADHARLTRLAREWWDERPPHIERFWFRHFGPTTFVATTPDGRPVALAIGFTGATDRTRGVIQVVAVAGRFRRTGVGRAMVQAVEERLVEAGATSVEAVIWPGNRAGVRFLEALGYAAVTASPATPLYGIPAFADYDGPGEDRAIFERRLPRTGE